MLPAAFFALALQCAPEFPDPTLLFGLAMRESHLDPGAIHENRNGSRDYGLMQINERNFPSLGLTPATALDPCQSIRAAARLLAMLSRYNTGSPVRGIANGYAGAVMREVQTIKDRPPVPPAGPAAAIETQPGHGQTFFGDPS